MLQQQAAANVPSTNNSSIWASGSFNGIGSLGEWYAGHQLKMVKILINILFHQIQGVQAQPASTSGSRDDGIQPKPSPATIPSCQFCAHYCTAAWHGAVETDSKKSGRDCCHAFFLTTKTEWADDSRGFGASTFARGGGCWESSGFK